MTYRKWWWKSLLTTHTRKNGRRRRENSKVEYTHSPVALVSAIVRALLFILEANGSSDEQAAFDSLGSFDVNAQDLLIIPETLGTQIY